MCKFQTRWVHVGRRNVELVIRDFTRAHHPGHQMSQGHIRTNKCVMFEKTTSWPFEGQIAPVFDSAGIFCLNDLPGLPKQGHVFLAGSN